MQILSDAAIKAFLANYPHWQRTGVALTGKYECANFAECAALVHHCITVMRETDHHPLVSFGYNTVEIVTCTHDAGDVVTDRDAEFITRLTETLVQQ